LNAELRRRAYLDAMQVAVWLPRTELPFAAPSRAELLLDPEPPAPDITAPAAAIAAAVAPVATPAPSSAPSVRPTPAEILRPKAAAAVTPAAPVAEAEPETPVPAPEPPPRFSLQLMRAGNCLLLVELPTGEALQRRDPAYLLLKDLLRAAGLPDSPQIIAEPVRWPLFAGGSLDQGPDAARDYLQGLVAAQLEQQAAACLWLVGTPAMRHCGELDDQRQLQEVSLEGLCSAWALPGLERLMEDPGLKRELWHAMGRVMRRWQAPTNPDDIAE